MDEPDSLPIPHPVQSDRIQPANPRVPGQYASQFTVPDDFNEPLPDDILETFLLPVDPSTNHWWGTVFGSFADCPEFDEMEKLVP